MLNAKEHVAPKAPGKDNSNAKWEKTKDRLHINVLSNNSVTNDNTIVVPHLLKNLIILFMIICTDYFNKCFLPHGFNIFSQKYKFFLIIANSI